MSREYPDEQYQQFLHLQEYRLSILIFQEENS